MKMSVPLLLAFQGLPVHLELQYPQFLQVLYLAHPALMNFPFILAGGLKIIYDLFLYLGFISKKPKIEK